MSTQKLYDMHSHSKNSPDGFDTVTSMCEAAIKQGLSALAITDHCDLPLEDDFYENAIKQASIDIEQAKSVYNNKNFELIFGLELSGAIFDIPFSKNLIEKYPFDFVLGSLHGMKDEPDYHLFDYTVTDYREKFETYFETLLNQCKLNLYDGLAHLDYPVRYVKLQNVPCDISLYSDYIDEILKHIIDNGKSIEVNTSGLYYPFKATSPDFPIIKRYKELGGEFITTGSDSHVKENIGRGIKEAMALIQNAGFKYVTTYKNRKATPIKIEKL